MNIRKNVFRLKSVEKYENQKKKKFFLKKVGKTDLTTITALSVLRIRFKILYYRF